MRFRPESGTIHGLRPVRQACRGPGDHKPMSSMRRVQPFKYLPPCPVRRLRPACSRRRSPPSRRRRPRCPRSSRSMAPCRTAASSRARTAACTARRSSNTLVSGGLVYRSTVNGSSVTTLHQLTIRRGLRAQGRAARGQRRPALRLDATSGMPTEASTRPARSTAWPSTGRDSTILHRFAAYTETNVNGNPINTDGAYPESAAHRGQRRSTCTA